MRLPILAVERITDDVLVRDDTIQAVLFHRCPDHLDALVAHDGHWDFTGRDGQQDLLRTRESLLEREPTLSVYLAEDPYAVLNVERLAVLSWPEGVERDAGCSAGGYQALELLLRGGGVKVWEEFLQGVCSGFFDGVHGVHESAVEVEDDQFRWD
ncbi:hypothetical protein ASPSYDRAFT_1162773 [Aspergillus sydowii CBS 593.65]|uniref:Uncharacterized protein n=1 Tax=Aspergillus sydowii CBS 593.65 TaxID=1036612 RepID=A0A1L9T2J6_9EURO|nr:uncharacterized protein ASPSYDRAFT_1162773 [Aspergillus sydowii CBS 593.65]OJJ53656.1 hypothetical protein ASPSYDRAFT_1162773 [Aspergillus sydowii CBS 593.65]